MDLIQFLSSFNWQTIIGMFVISWYFNHDMKQVIYRQTDRTDKLYEMYCETQKEIKQLYVDLLNDRKKSS